MHGGTVHNVLYVDGIDSGIVGIENVCIICMFIIKFIHYMCVMLSNIAPSIVQYGMLWMII